MRTLLIILIVLLILSVLGLIPVLYVRGDEPAQRPREGGTFGVILNDRVYTLDTTKRIRPQVTPHYPQYSPWQQYESRREFNRYDYSRYNRGFRSRWYRVPMYRMPWRFDPTWYGYGW